MSKVQVKIVEFNTQLEELWSLEENLVNSDRDDGKGILELVKGCRVRCKHDNGETIEGRVLFYYNDNHISVNRDGYKHNMNFKLNQLENLSTGTWGRIERQIWFIKKKISSLQTEILLESYDFLDFDLKLKLDLSPINLTVQIFDVKKIEYLNIYMISFCKEGESEIRKTFHSSQIF